MTAACWAAGEALCALTAIALIYVDGREIGPVRLVLLSALLVLAFVCAGGLAGAEGVAP
jgi:hypothetical protein